MSETAIEPTAHEVVEAIVTQQAAPVMDRRVLMSYEHQDFIVNFWKGLRFGGKDYPQGSRLSGRYLLMEHSGNRRVISNLMYQGMIYALPSTTPGECDSPVPTSDDFEAAVERGFKPEEGHEESQANTRDLPPQDRETASPSARSGTAYGEDTGAEGERDIESFDPGAHTVQQVMAFVSKYPELSEGVLEAERAGQNRSTLVKWLEG